ncbi:bifunctional nuclease family protein [Citricoccus sp. K5]|uniref:bifunctional nuclease family protein n=1 Tax=Citricoccus sp. K5 TaxID=2653135 RepID=UPI0012F285A6|nr:bifunctional nuclease family protein [Citricoccus sp. K5]VXB47039.1 conserved hypothetical protein [Citricoccus sp. K5]
MSLPDVEMTVLGVRVELPGNQPLVLLQDPGTGTLVPIWIGAPEASAIALWQQGLTPPRPMTHDLLIEVLSATGTALESVRIGSVEDAVFHAELILDNGARVDARASDAIACALRAEAPVLCAAEVLEAAGVDPEQAEDVDEDSEDSEDGVDEAVTGVTGAAERDAELNRFREFLDNVDPEDFADGGSSQS